MFEAIQTVLRKVDCLTAIDKLMRKAGRSCAKNTAAASEGGVVKLCLNTFTEAEELYDLLVGVGEKAKEPGAE